MPQLKRILHPEFLVKGQVYLVKDDRGRDRPNCIFYDMAVHDGCIWLVFFVRAGSGPLAWYDFYFSITWGKNAKILQLT